MWHTHLDSRLKYKSESCHFITLKLFFCYLKIVILNITYNLLISMISFDYQND